MRFLFELIFAVLIFVSTGLGSDESSILNNITHSKYVVGWRAVRPIKDMQNLKVTSRSGARIQIGLNAKKYFEFMPNAMSDADKLILYYLGDDDDEPGVLLTREASTDTYIKNFLKRNPRSVERLFRDLTVRLAVDIDRRGVRATNVYYLCDNASDESIGFNSVPLWEMEDFKGEKNPALYELLINKSEGSETIEACLARYPIHAFMIDILKDLFKYSVFAKRLPPVDESVSLVDECELLSTHESFGIAPLAGGGSGAALSGGSDGGACDVPVGGAGMSVVKLVPERQAFFCKGFPVSSPLCLANALTAILLCCHPQKDEAAYLEVEKAIKQLTNDVDREALKKILNGKSGIDITMMNAVFFNVWGAILPPALDIYKSQLAAVMGLNNCITFTRGTLSMSGVKEHINAQCSELTQGRIRSILDSEPSLETIMSIMSTCTLSGKWLSPFDASQTMMRPFSNSDGTVAEVLSMCTRKICSVWEDPETKGVYLVLDLGSSTGWNPEFDKPFDEIWYRVMFYKPANPADVEDISNFHFEEARKKVVVADINGISVQIPKGKIILPAQDIIPFAKAELAINRIFQEGNMNNIQSDAYLAVWRFAATIAFDEVGIEAGASSYKELRAKGGYPQKVAIDSAFRFSVYAELAPHRSQAVQDKSPWPVGRMLYSYREGVELGAAVQLFNGIIRNAEEIQPIEPSGK